MLLYYIDCRVRVACLTVGIHPFSSLVHLRYVYFVKNKYLPQVYTHCSSMQNMLVRIFVQPSSTKIDHTASEGRGISKWTLMTRGGIFKLKMDVRFRTARRTISRQPNFTKFAPNASISEAMKTLGTEF